MPLAPENGQVQPWTTNKEGGDGFILKFDMDGNFKMRIGGTPKGPASNDTNGGINGTPLLYLAADMVVDPATNRLYVADGYGNRRVLIVDANTGKYIGHFGAYGNNPIDDAGAEAAGTWIDDSTKGNKKPAFFRNPVHCVKIADDGKIYVCDRGNDRIQVFDKNDPALGKPCSNPDGAARQMRFRRRAICQRSHQHHRNRRFHELLHRQGAELPLCRRQRQHDDLHSEPKQSRRNWDGFGRSGRMAGEFHWLHQVSVDSKGNIYTGEVDTGKRIQKFLRYGATGCSGTGSTTVGGVLEK